MMSDDAFVPLVKIRQHSWVCMRQPVFVTPEVGIRVSTCVMPVTTLRRGCRENLLRMNPVVAEHAIVKIPGGKGKCILAYLQLPPRIKL